MNRKESLFDSMGGPEKGRLVLDIVFEEIVQTPPSSSPDPPPCPSPCPPAHPPPCPPPPPSPGPQNDEVVLIRASCEVARVTAISRVVGVP